MEKNKKIKSLNLLVFGFILSISCASKEDPNYAWMMAILQPLAPVGDSAQTLPGSDSPSEVPFSMTIEDLNGGSDFLFENTTTYPLRIKVRDLINPISGTLVQIIELGQQDVAGNAVFKAITDSSGNVTGSFTINNRAEPKVRLQVTHLGKDYFFEINLINILEVSRDIFLFTSPLVQVPAPIIDADGDGIQDSKDEYPNDPSRATMIRIPTESFYTICYEDLFPKKGDADFNDYVVRVYNEEDLDSQGRVTRIRGYYTHVAKGAGYNHTLHIKFPNTVSGNYTLTRAKPNGNEYFSDSRFLQKASSIEILPESNTTIPQSNTSQGQNFLPGDKAEWELVLDSPVSKLELGNSPYDLYIQVKNTKLAIHRLGLYKNADGSDSYLDPAGFPWVFMIPGEFSWPLEKKNINNAYSFFDDWYTSSGANYKDWYLNKEASQVVSF
ncbi:MAG: LruC domain-containing protein [Leptospiraceae bacterium]|nr:LruC domain-containing protein [Leptospiraceae bacterium]MCZ8346953.1 LruC domain-containing protein [Leptospiraceae bacterium]